MGWVRGQWLATCDLCGFEFLSGKMKKRWDGLMVDDACYETQHPQEFVRSVKESTIPWARPEPEGIDVSPEYPAWLSPPIIGNVNTFYAAAVIVEQNLEVPLLTNENLFYGFVVNAIQTLTPSLVTNTNVFYAPTVSLLNQDLTPSLFSNSQTFYGPVLTTSYDLEPGLFSNTNTFYAATITQGTYEDPFSPGFGTYSNAAFWYAYTQLRVKTNGTSDIIGSEGTNATGLWFTPPTVGKGTGHYVRFTRTAATIGPYSTATASTGWLELTSDRLVAVTADSGATESYEFCSATYTVEIATDSGGSNIVSTDYGITITAEGTV